MTEFLCKLSITSFAVLFTFLWMQKVQGQNASVPECIDGPSKWYKGTHDRTVSGILCQRWDKQSPHIPKREPYDGKHHNYCRNPEGDLDGTWCYTTNTTVRWEYCRIPKCPDDSRVIWTNFDGKTQTSHIVSLQADPELVKVAANEAGKFNVTILVNSSETTEFWAVTGDYHRDIIFYTDYKSRYIGVRHLDSGITLKVMEGMAYGIEGITYDWASGNIYWADSDFKWIMVVENTFRYYRPIYRVRNAIPYAIALHAKNRQLYFSTFKQNEAKIIVTDMAGKNEKILLQYPKVYDVTGITIDYTDERLYWTDSAGFAAIVKSCKLDGTNVTRPYLKTRSVFWNIGAYLDYLFVTDLRKFYDEKGDAKYSVWVFNKNGEQAFRYTLAGKPRGITVLSKNEERDPTDNVPALGECKNNMCEHICLPRINETAECVCSLGYYKVDETKCKPKLSAGDAIYIADSGQGKIFQIPLNGTSTYSVVPAPSITSKVTTIATNMATGQIYWYDRKYNVIKKANIDGTKKSALTSRKQVKSLAVDPHTGNIFFVDGTREQIYVMSPNGHHLAPITKNPSVNSSINRIELDCINRKLYWTDSNSNLRQGQVWRMNYDGSNKELVLDKLHWPNAITVDYNSKSLYVSEAITAMIYQIPLASIQNITNTSVSGIRKQIDIAAHLTRYAYFIKDMKIFNNNMYIIDTKTSRVETMNLAKGAASLTTFISKEFFFTTSLAVGSKALYSTYLSNITSPCSKKTSKTCSQICVDISATHGQCLCDENYDQQDMQCVQNNSMKRNDPPRTVNNTCPNDKSIYAMECSTYAKQTWIDPTWTDDTTSVENLTLSVTPVLQNISVGTHSFAYTAKDAQGKFGFCHFTVTVVAIICPNPPVIPKTVNMTSTSLTCGNNFGSSYEISCENPQYVIVESDDNHEIARFNHTLMNKCISSGEWILSNLMHLKCMSRQSVEGMLSPSKGLSSGALAAICVILVLFVIAGIAVTFLCVRNRPVWEIARFKFPVLWKGREEDEVNINSNIDAPYSMMT